MSRLMTDIKAAIGSDSYTSFRESFLAGYQTTNELVRLEQKERWLKAHRDSAAE
jgi:hypothetical protein